MIPILRVFSSENSHQPFSFGVRGSDARRFGVDGIKPYKHKNDDDIYLYVYSKKTNAQFFESLIIDLVDVLHVAHAYINQLYDLDKYLSKLKKKDYLPNSEIMIHQPSGGARGLQFLYSSEMIYMPVCQNYRFKLKAFLSYELCYFFMIAARIDHIASSFAARR